MARLFGIALTLAAARAKTGGKPPDGWTSDDCDDWVHTTCFNGEEYSEDYDLDEDFSFVELFADAPTPPGKCGLCGHGSKDSVQKPSDCITCDDDSYIVYYVHGDGTGFCVDEDTEKYLFATLRFVFDPEDRKLWNCPGSPWYKEEDENSEDEPPSDAEPTESLTYEPTYQPSDGEGDATDEPTVEPTKEDQPMDKPSDGGGDDVICPFPLEPIDGTDCPDEIDKDDCADEDLRPGMTCRARDGQCGTDPELDNCAYDDKVRDVYRVKDTPAPTKEPTKEPTEDRVCPNLEPVECDEKPCGPGTGGCPADGPDEDDCASKKLEVGMTCRAKDGQCDTDPDLDNCMYGKVRDVYRVVEDPPTDEDPPSDDPVCPPYLEPVECGEYPCGPGMDGCPEKADHGDCKAEGIEVGDTCRARDGECGTDADLNNCEYDDKVRNIYRVVGSPPAPPADYGKLYCASQGFDGDAYDRDRFAYKAEDPRTDEMGNVEGSCAYAAYEDNGQWARCCCGFPDSCEADANCPVLRPLTPEECPDYDKGELVWYFECDNPELTKDAWCKSNNGECGTSKDLDNCYYKKPNADLYIVVEAAGGGGDRKRPTLLPTMEKLPCPTLRALEFEECPIDDDEVFHFTCNDPMLEVGEICKSNNYECGTNKKLDNCVYKGKDADLYMVVDTPGPPGPKPTAKGCPQLEPLREDECPGDGLVEYFSCDRIELHPGMLCKSRENECATDRGLNNCIYPSWDEGRTSDIYRVVGDSPAYRPTRAPTESRCPIELRPLTENECPAEGTVNHFACDDIDLRVDDVCESNRGECGTDKNANTCFYGGKYRDLYLVVEEYVREPTPRPTYNTDVWYVDTEVRFNPQSLDDTIGGDWRTSTEVKDYLAEALVQADVADQRADVLKIKWGAPDVVGDDMFSRRLDSWDSVPAVVSLELRGRELAPDEIDEDKADLVADRLRAACVGPGEPTLRAALEVQGNVGADLADSLDETATAGLAWRTIERDGPPGDDDDMPIDDVPFPTSQPTVATSEPTPVVAPAPAPAPVPRKKKKSSDDDEIIEGMDNAGAIVLILFLCILGCACCAGGAWWAKDQGFVGGTKSRAYTPDPYEPHSVDHDFEHFDPDSRDAEGYHDEEGQDAYDRDAPADDYGAPEADDENAATYEDGGAWPAAEDGGADDGGAWPAAEDEPYESPYANQDETENVMYAGGLAANPNVGLADDDMAVDDMTTTSDPQINAFEDLVDAELAKRGASLA